MTETRVAILQDGARIRQLRKARLKIDDEQFAARLGIRSASLRNIEGNRKPVSLALMIKIAGELNEPVDGLLRKAEAAA